MGLASRKLLRRSVGTGEFVLGYTRPRATNTGLSDPSILTPYYGDYNITTNGTVIENQDIYGTIGIAAANVVIRNCRINGKPKPAGGHPTEYLIQCWSGNCVNALIENCELRSAYDNNYRVTAIIGHDYTAHRNHIYHVVDGFGAYPVASDPGGSIKVNITGNYVHSLLYYTQAGQGAQVHPFDDKTHNDGIQIQGGRDILVEGNNIQAFFATEMGEQGYDGHQAGAVVQLNAAVGSPSAMIRRNWMDGGFASINAAGSGLYGVNIGSIIDNRFGRNQKHMAPGNNGLAFATSNQTIFTYSGNIYEDTGTPAAYTTGWA